MAIAVYKSGKLHSTTSSGNVSQYSGEKTGGELAHWRLFGTNPVDFIRESYDLLASRNATLYHTFPIARACVKKSTTYTIGKGLFFKSLPDFEFLEMTEKDAADWGRKFTKLLHYEKTAVKHYKKQKMLVKEAKITGDAVLYLLREDKKGVPFDPIVVNGNEAIDPTKNGEGYSLGIKHDIWGRRTAFWSKTAQKDVPFTDDNGNQVAIQFLFTERAGQLRGFGLFGSEIARAKNFDRMWDAVLERMVLEATQVGYFNASTTDIGAQARAMMKQAAGHSDPDFENTMALKELGGRTATKTGGMFVLENEESMNFNDMVTPSNNFGMANEWTINLFAMATNYPPEVIMGRYNTSYTAHKGAFNDFWKVIEDEREDFTSNVENLVNFEYLKHFVSTGQIEVKEEFWSDPKIQLAYLAGTFLGPIPGHINPLQEVNAQKTAVAEGFTLRSSVAANYGNDFWNSIETWAKEQEAWQTSSPEFKAKMLQQEINSQAQAQAEKQQPVETTKKATKNQDGQNNG